MLGGEESAKEQLQDANFHVRKKEIYKNTYISAYLYK